MASRLELAPIANTAETETTLAVERVSNENLERVDNGLEPRRRSPGNETEHDGSLKPNLPRDEYPVYPKPKVRPPLDINLYATKKTIAQGMMDLALLTANANQLRYVLESGSSGPYFYFSVVLISLSIVLQLVIGIVLIFLGRYNMAQIEHVHKSERLNNWVIAIVFLITAINVLISAFGIDPVEKMDPVLIVDAALQSLKAERLETTTIH